MRVGLLYYGSEQCDKAAQQCVQLLAPHKNVQVFVLSVVEQPSTDPPFGYLPDEADEIVGKGVEEMREKQAPLAEKLRAHKIKFKMIIEKGDPRSLLKGFVEENEIDLLILGSRGLSGAMGFLLGSTSQYAMHNVNCSILVAK